jgi:hypothetical protein
MLLSSFGFAWSAKGGWQYIAHHEDRRAVITIPMPDGTAVPITHKAVDDAQKTLGVVTCPSRSSYGSLLQMKEKTQKWLDSLTAGQLHRRMMWFSVDRQLWPLVKYGLCCSMATLPELETALLGGPADAFFSEFFESPKISPKILRAYHIKKQADHGLTGSTII